MRRKDRSRLFTSYRLVRSLTERDHRLFIQIEKRDSKERGYIELYKVLKGQKEFRRDRIVSKLEQLGYSEYQVINFGNYLFYQILRILTLSTITSPNDVFALMHQIKVLIQLGEKSEALNLVQLGKEKAKENELFEIEAVFCREEIAILNNSRFRREKIDIIQNRIAELDQALRNAGEISTYLTLHQKALRLIESKWDEAPERENGIQGLEANWLNLRKGGLNTTTAKYFDNSIAYLLERAKGNREKSFSCLQKIIQIWEENEFLLSGNLLQLIKYIYQGALFEISRENETGYFYFFQKLEKIGQKAGLELKAAFLFRKTVCEIQYAWLVGKELHAQRAIDDICSESSEIELMEDHEKFFLSSIIAYFFLSISKGKQAIPWVNQALEVSANQISPREETLIRLLQILSLIDSGQKDLAHYRIKALEKLIGRKKVSWDSWKIVRKHLYAICETYNNSQEQKYWADFAKNLPSNPVNLLWFDLKGFVVACSLSQHYFGYHRAKGRHQ